MWVSLYPQTSVGVSVIPTQSGSVPGNCGLGHRKRTWTREGKKDSRTVSPVRTLDITSRIYVHCECPGSSSGPSSLPVPPGTDRTSTLGPSMSRLGTVHLCRHRPSRRPGPTGVRPRWSLRRCPFRTPVVSPPYNTPSGPGKVFDMTVSLDGGELPHKRTIPTRARLLAPTYTVVPAPISTGPARCPKRRKPFINGDGGCEQPHESWNSDK